MAHCFELFFSLFPRRNGEGKSLAANFSGDHFLSSCILHLLLNDIQEKCGPTRGMIPGSTRGTTRDILTCLTALSDSPTHLLNSSGPFTAKKLSPLSVASALATRVLLQPGGPYIRIPWGGRIPSRWNACREKSTKWHVYNGCKKTTTTPWSPQSCLVWSKWCRLTEQTMRDTESTAQLRQAVSLLHVKQLR